MSHMAREAAEAPEAAARFLARNGPALAELGARLRRAPPAVALTCGRGSSDNAAHYFKYLAEIVQGVPCASIGASVISVYGGALKAGHGVSVTISQSGRSPDVLALQAAARRSGALAVAVVNDEESPAARQADICLPLCCGPETSVAATKTFIVSCVAGAAIVAHWRGDGALIDGVARLPDALSAACALDWEALGGLAADARSLYVLGRGPALPMALETALKLKETCAIHAEGFSPAEAMHGPWELVEAGFPVLALMPEDAAFGLTQEVLARMRHAGARVLATEAGGLDHVRTGEPLLDPIAMMQPAYPAIARLAARRGRDPDRPRRLAKITETL